MTTRVAPHMGAWIETDYSTDTTSRQRVAPHMGAWIETRRFRKYIPDVIKSHPTWVRGLKLSLKPFYQICEVSHPTWVRGLKHQTFVRFFRRRRSHPTWVRGLKHERDNFRLAMRIKSHPTWVRGLKQFLRSVTYTCKRVAPHMGAWIETSNRFIIGCI